VEHWERTLENLGMRIEYFNKNAIKIINYIKVILGIFLEIINIFIINDYFLINTGQNENI
jgi:hypothetical protein